MRGSTDADPTNKKLINTTAGLLPIFDNKMAFHNKFTNHAEKRDSGFMFCLC